MSQYVLFCVCLLWLARMCETHPGYCVSPTFVPFLSLSNTLLNKYTTICLSILPWMDVWAVSSFGILWIKLPWTLPVNGHIFSFPLGTHLGVECWVLKRFLFNFIEHGRVGYFHVHFIAQAPESWGTWKKLGEDEKENPRYFSCLFPLIFRATQKVAVAIPIL